tara:strand:- start:4052 stop:4198 length:147 start_codon:yes stop_codon:yes gene_type:complete
MPELNAYFKKMLDAKQKEQQTFTYNGSVYYRTKTKTGLVTYKKREKRQ